ncbi:DUF2384 domain-containing protein [Candidatus Woesearchaeota archaeon]|nr:DUF2384 domain-containing protein [Candidatus Woesearchaeota archaeon]
MNIDDILERKEFSGLDRFLTNEMKKSAGLDLLNRMNYVFGSRKSTRDWFYSNIPSLGGARPYDLCKSGKQLDVYEVLEKLEWGLY